MAYLDPRIDDYISRAPAYAEPILIHFRNLIHQSVPDIQETMKWSVPHFDCDGAPAFAIAAFKQHVALNFWKSTLMVDKAGIFAKAEKGAAGSIGKIKSFKDIPPDEVLMDYFREAAELNYKGIKVEVKKAAAPKAELPVPDDLIAAFKTHTAAMQHFQQFSPSAKRDYLEWLEDAKTGATRQKRLAIMLEWAAEGKTRHWKYK